MENLKNLNEEISKLSDEELIEQIQNTNNLQLSNIGLMAYVELFNRNIYLKSLLKNDKDLINELLKEDAKFSEVYNMVENKVIKLDSIVDIEKLNENLDIEELKKLRTSIVKVLRTLAAYSTEISYTNEIAKDLLYKEFIKQNESEIDKNIDYQKLFDSISKFVMEDPTNMKNKVMDLTNILPMRVAKTKYYDIVSKAFSRNLRYSSKRKTDVVLSRYKTILNGSLESEYGLYFSRYFRKAQEARQMELKDMSEDELRKIYDDTYKTMVEIGTIANVVREFGVIVNRIIAVCILQENILEQSDNYNIKSLTNAWTNYSEKESDASRSKLLESYKALFKVLDDKFKKTNENLQLFTMENFNRKNKVSDELKSELGKVQYVLDFINDYALEQEEILDTDYVDIVEKEYLDEAVKSLVQFIDRNIDQMENLQRRTRMKRLLALTEGAFMTPQEFFEYVANSINMTNKREDLIATINNILELMTRYRGIGNVKH
ncbi:hypothetical protein Curi_c09370 [Gottschalkia acidurici 9a]|uniref:Uncharacterized protein n=1 Tax=Gottschalkia acidurici (strain ATCC 7906 / DSM 604 / BCRC 14475 / CIP 104303 / KCTC 5404 / NCIMB 10678 / 9a) TaxID=1128398 RepID=K0AVS2_GOTA9|nr:hypothetical protein [Gottschalkia acidurici]AFS77953.1 hypothetical protein Curi_c09370 [Gottschalkia acidurici 9a]